MSNQTKVNNPVNNDNKEVVKTRNESDRIPKRAAAALPAQISDNPTSNNDQTQAPPRLEPSGLSSDLVRQSPYSTIVKQGGKKSVKSKTSGNKQVFQPMFAAKKSIATEETDPEGVTRPNITIRERDFIMKARAGEASADEIKLLKRPLKSNSPKPRDATGKFAPASASGGRSKPSSRYPSPDNTVVERLAPSAGTTLPMDCQVPSKSLIA
jgi:hypothetical protein